MAVCLVWRPATRSQASYRLAPSDEETTSEKDNTTWFLDGFLSSACVPVAPTGRFFKSRESRNGELVRVVGHELVEIGRVGLHANLFLVVVNSRVRKIRCRPDRRRVPAWSHW